MFVDLVGSTALSERFDPEDMREIIRAYQNAVTGEIARFSGQIAKFMGDGVLAYFGWPIAHEDDAERAARAGLAATAAVAGLRTPSGEPLAARVGVATGVVVVGELFGEGSAQEESVIGEAPNLAARLEALAGAGQVVLSDATRRMLGRLFLFSDLGAHRLKGFSRPQRAWQVLEESDVASRFEAHRGDSVAPLIGRNEELQLLTSRWRLAASGEGQVVLLAGEPGIGKSHLVDALRDSLALEPHTHLNYFCSPFHVDSALFPVIAQLERAIGFQRDDDTDTKLDKLGQFFPGEDGDAQTKASLIGALLSIDTGDRYPPLNLSPQIQRTRTLAALVDELEQLAAQQPVLIILEDAHWLDPTTRELFGMLIERVLHLPVLLVITFRPEFAPPWRRYQHVTKLSLSRLAREQGRAIIMQVAAKATLSREVYEQILDRTDGVPLFVEELTKAVIDSSALRPEGGRGHAISPAFVTIPATLHDSLMARLDSLGAVKNIAQIGAVIGREFTFDLLAELTETQDSSLEDALDQLVASELVFRRGAPPTASYSFKHALIQDAAYQSLLNAKRREIHGRIVAAIERRYEHVLATDPELLAHHCTGAGLIEKAIGYWDVAGKRAIKRSANAEAAQHLNKGLALIQTLPEDPGRNRLELTLRLSLGPALMAIKGQSDAAVGGLYTRVLELAGEGEHDDDHFRALWGSWRHHFIRAEHASALSLARRCLTFVKEQQIAVLEPGAHFALGGSLLWTGNIASATEHFEQANAIYDPHKHGRLAFEIGQDPGVSSLAYSALALWFLGFPDQAETRIGRALRTAESLGHPASMAAVSTYDAIFQSFYCDWARARHRAEATITLSTDQGFPQHLAIGRIIRGRALAETGEFDQGIMEIKGGVATRREIGANISLPHFLGLLAEACSLAGRVDEGLHAIREAIDLSEATEEAFFQPELHRIEGDLLVKSNRPDGKDTATACYRRALDFALAQGAMSVELRAAVHLARAAADEDEVVGARKLVSSILARFTEGFETVDLCQAKALLTEPTQD